MKKFIITIIAALTLFSACQENRVEKTQEIKASDQEIIELINQQPEIQEWKAELDANPKSGNFGLRIESEGDQKGIQVYESFDTHTATFAWYTYDPSTKTLSKSQ